MAEDRRPGLLPWSALLHLTASRLGWSPETFWRATPWEVSAALGLKRHGPARSRLEALMRAHPDRITGKGDEYGTRDDRG